MFYEEIKTKQNLSYISVCSLSILYNSKFILMAMSLGTNAVVVMRVHCTLLYFSIKIYNTGNLLELTRDCLDSTHSVKFGGLNLNPTPQHIHTPNIKNYVFCGISRKLRAMFLFFFSFLKTGANKVSNFTQW